MARFEYLHADYKKVGNLSVSEIEISDKKNHAIIYRSAVGEDGKIRFYQTNKSAFADFCSDPKSEEQKREK